MAGFSAVLRRCREDAGMSQTALAAALDVSRPTVTQWEADRHLPSSAHVERMDEVLGAQGQLIEAAEVARRGADSSLPPPAREVPDSPQIVPTSVAAVFVGVGDRLRDSVRTSGTAVGWSRLLDRARPPSPWSTAIGIRTLQMLDRADVDLYAMAQWLAGQQSAGGWANHHDGATRPEVTAIVLDALWRLGYGAPTLDRSWTWLAEHFGDGEHGRQDRRRPFVISIVLDCAARVRPESPLVARLSDLLVGLRQGPMWTAKPGAPLAAPSPAHTGRAINALRSAVPVLPRPARERAQQAIREAAGAMVAAPARYESVALELERGPDDAGPSVLISHFTAAHVLRALAGLPGVELAADKRDSLLRRFWDAYVPAERVWSWPLEGDLPLWATLDAVGALRDVVTAGQSVGHIPVLAPPAIDKEDSP